MYRRSHIGHVSSTQSSTTANDRSLVSRIAGVGLRRETYANLLYLLARFPLGVAYFAVLTAGVSLGVGLLPVLVGVPILAGVLALGGYLGVIEAELLSRVLDRDVAYEIVDPNEPSTTAYLKTVATTPRNYLLVAFGFGSFLVGVHLFVAIVAGFSLGLVLVAAPLLYSFPGVEYGPVNVAEPVTLGPLSIESGVYRGVDTLPEALAASLLGVVICLVGLHAVNLTASVLAGVTERLLSTPSE
jgi:hypothetical protein